MGSTAYVQGPELHVLLDLCLISKNKTHLIVFILLHTYGNNYINPTLSLIQFNHTRVLSETWTT